MNYTIALVYSFIRKEEDNIPSIPLVVIYIIVKYLYYSFYCTNIENKFKYSKYGCAPGYVLRNVLYEDRYYWLS